MTFVISISLKVVSIAAARWASTSRRAMVLRRVAEVLEVEAGLRGVDPPKLVDGFFRRRRKLGNGPTDEAGRESAQVLLREAVGLELQRGIARGGASQGIEPGIEMTVLSNRLAEMDRPDDLVDAQ